MRMPGTVAFLAALSVVASAQSPVADPAAAVIAAAREALGGEKKLAAMKNFVATGQTKQLRGENLAAIEFEIAMELSDKYVRKDEIPLQESDPTTVGFNGDALILVPAPTSGVPARLAAVKQDATRLTLGLFAASYSVPVTFTYVGKAEAPQGKADVLDVRGPGGFAARLFVNADSHLPIMVTWQAPAQGQRGGGAAATPPAESRLYFGDYRDVGGQQLPFRLRRAVGSDTIEETVFDRYRINTKIDPRKFEARE